MPSNKQTWIAGGIGITPFLSMSNSLPDNGYEIDLYYCVNNKSEAIFLNELLKVSKKIKKFNVFPIYSDENKLSVDKLLKSNNSEIFMLCGPRSMMKELEKQLINNGISRSNIYYEEFSLS